MNIGMRRYLKKSLLFPSPALATHSKRGGRISQPLSGLAAYRGGLGGARDKPAGIHKGGLAVGV